VRPLSDLAREGLGQVVALTQITFQVPKVLQLVSDLHTFYDHLQI
jgi:hypothetical protein